MAIDRRLHTDLRPLPEEDALLRVIGHGPSFPLRFSPKGGVKSVEITDGVSKINDSIHIILSTRPGERVNRPTFGSRLPELVFEPNDDILLPLLKRETHVAIHAWEKRVRVHSIAFINPVTQAQVTDSSSYQERLFLLRNANEIGIFIKYVILRTNQTGSYVYPFRRDTAPLSYNTPSHFDEVIT